MLSLWENLWNKEALVYLAFTVDAVNTFVTFPLFVTKGPKWMLEVVPPAKGERIPPSEADREAFQVLWDLFLVCYEGYFGFTISTLICIYRYPETVPIFAYSLFALYLYKAKYLLNKRQTTSGTLDGKLGTVLFFFLPCYGGFSVLHSFECLQESYFLK